MANTTKHDKDYLDSTLLPVSVTDGTESEHSCWICLEVATESRKRFMHQGCACRGSAGFCHVECRAEYTCQKEWFVHANGSLYNQWRFCPICLQQQSREFRVAIAYERYDQCKALDANDDKHKKALHHLVSVLSRILEHEKALEFARLLYDIEKSVRACELIGNSLRELGFLDEALSAYKEGLHRFRQTIGIPTTAQQNEMLHRLNQSYILIWDEMRMWSSLRT